MAKVKEAKLFKGPIEEPRVYDEERLGRAGYTVPRPLPSVTTILRVLNKPAFVPAAMKAMGDFLLAKEGEPITSDIVAEAKKAWGARSREAMDIGSRIHKLCEDHGRGLTIDFSDEREEVKNGFKAYLQWIDHTGFVALPTGIEKVVAGDGYAGTCDAVGILADGTPCLVDWKSGKGGSIYPEYILQWNAYAKALNIEQGFIVSFDKETGHCYHKEMKYDSLTYQCFLACREIYEWQERHNAQEKPKCKRTPIQSPIVWPSGT